MGKAGRHGQSQSPQQQDNTPSSLSPNGKGHVDSAQYRPGRGRENATSGEGTSPPLSTGGGEGRLKSRLEIALERLKEESPEGEPRSLTDKQKERIATIRREYQAKLAEAEILHHTAVKKELLRATPETLQKVGQIKEDYARQTAKLQTQMEKKIEQVRRRGAKQT
jgi:hypothetical protein